MINITLAKCFEHAKPYTTIWTTETEMGRSDFYPIRLLVSRQTEGELKLVESYAAHGVFCAKNTDGK